MNSRLKIASTFLLIISMSGCVAMQYAHHSSNTYPARDPNCKVAFTALAPNLGQYEELGEVVAEGRQLDGSVYAMVSSKFIEKAREQACKVGGDLVLKEVNGLGQYVRAIIFRKK